MFLFRNFRRWKIRSFFKPKTWWKDDIYWLLKSSCFELFWDEKYGLFFSQKVDEKWYLLITGKSLFWTFWWWEIRSIFQPKSWWKDNIYLVFLSFPWYCRTFSCSETHTVLNTYHTSTIFPFVYVLSNFTSFRLKQKHPKICFD